MKETVFTVVQWRRVAIDDAAMAGFDILPVGSLQKKWGILDGFYLTDEHSDKVPFHAEIVGELEKAIDYKVN